MQSFIAAIVSIFGYLLRFIAAIIGIVLAFAGIILLITLVASLFAIPFTFFVPFDIWFFSPPYSVDSLLSDGWMTFLASAGLFLVVGVPLALLIYAGLKMVFDFESGGRAFSAVMLMLWMAGLAMMSFVVITALFI